MDDNEVGDEVDSWAAGFEIAELSRRTIGVFVDGEGMQTAVEQMKGAPPRIIAALALGLAGQIGGLIALGKVDADDLVEARAWVRANNG